MQKLSRREKMLIYILVLIVVAVIGVYAVILPTMSLVNQANDELALKQEEAINMQLAIAQLEQLREENREIAEISESIIADMLPLMLNEQLDRHITDSLLAHNLLPVSLQMEETVLTEVLPFGGPAAENSDPAGPAQAMVNRISLEFSGSMADFIAWADQVNGASTLRLEQLSVMPGDAAGGYNISCRLIAYSL